MIALLFLLGPAARAGADEITAETLTDRQVLAAIEAITEEIFDRKHPERYWEPESWEERIHGSPTQADGYTVLAALALLFAGESYQSPRLRPVIDHLAEVDLEGTYARSLRTSLWANLPPRFSDHLKRDAAWLLDTFREDIGGWGYTAAPGRTDNSLRQFGALGLWDARRRGISVPRNIWQRLERGYLDTQQADGGWNYTGDGPSTGSMTTAGLATLFITQDFLHAEAALPITNRRQSRRGNRDDAARNEEAIQHALRWMTANFTPEGNPGRQEVSNPRARYFYYYLYGVERVALASGRKHLADLDWYRHGAAEIICRLCEWDPDTATMSVHDRPWGDGRRAPLRVDDLAFGLMFLSRGRLPVVINKLQDESIRWNNRPRDVANLADWIAGESARHVVWQITDNDSPPAEWLDAPLLYFASHEAPEWAAAGGDPDSLQLQRLKRYLDLGGMLFALNEGPSEAAAGGRRDFAQAIEAAGTLMYPDYEWRTLDADHWAYTIHQRVERDRPHLRGLSNGVRELIILAPEGDLPATFQVRRYSQRNHVDTASNIYLYASELGRPRPRLAALERSPRHDGTGAQRHNGAHDAELLIFHARYDGNWNPEPAALEVFAERLRRDGDINIKVREHPLAELEEVTRGAIVIVSGVAEPPFSEAEWDAIERYVRGGGVILFETAGGMGDFAEHAEAILAQRFGQMARSLGRKPVVTGEGVPGAADLSRLDYRPFSLHVLGALDTRPRLRGIPIAGQARVLFSREDISHALLDQPCWGVHGYSPASAQRLLRNIILHAHTADQAATR